MDRDRANGARCYLWWIGVVSSSRVDTLKAKRDADRSLTHAQIKGIVDALKQNPPGTVNLEYPIGDAEANRFSGQVKDVLVTGGWTVNGPSAAAYAGTPRGFLLVVHPDDLNNPFGYTLQQALKGGGFDAPAEPNADQQGLRLIVGHKTIAK